MKALSSVIIGLITLLLLSGGLAQADGNVAKVRIAYSVADSRAIDVYVDNQRILSNVTFGTISNYIDTPPGNHKISLRPAGADPGTPPMQGEALLQFDGNNFYSVVVVGQANQTMELILLRDENAPTPPNKGRARFVHSSQEIPPTDICTVLQNDCFIKNLAYKGSATAELDIGNYSVDVRLHNSNDVVIPSLALPVRDGYVYTCFVMGLLNGTPQRQVICSSYVSRPEAVKPVPTLPGGGQPPTYPPITGAILAPQLMIGLLLVGLSVFGVGSWFIIRKFNR